MRHFLHQTSRIAGFGSNAGGGRFGPQVVRVLTQGADVTSGISPADPQMLTNKVAILHEPGNSAIVYGQLEILWLTPQPDGSYAFRGLYTTALYNVTDDHGQQPVWLSGDGTLGVPTYASRWQATCTIYLDLRGSVVRNHNGAPQMVDEHVNYNGTVMLFGVGGQATVSGQLYDCLEDPVTHDRLDYFCGSPTAAGTFM
jgi:hypothetical protein